MLLLRRQIEITHGIAIKSINFWFDMMQAQIRIVKGAQKK